ncbi:MAG TPA: tRNA (adenosine(37)-N6)-threonylcarbamoyltransferase complex dimerization subunit type 1 TsaB [Ktedonobacteraceae bacterium]|nr:tRNA (adenosine(37)-N6)-threonylcarbamoyltransferase complex dimerization subunit type 1 TsaB [Ktedonobacteraceae bacterium]
MLLLALDTSTRQASLALCSEEELLGEYTWHVGTNHSVELLPRIQRLFAECGKVMQDIDGVAVATGPGSFNGLRVALSTAKALAFGLKKPIVGVSTLDIIAAQQRQWNGPICTLLEAGRAELYAACYRSDNVMNEGGEVTYRLRQLGDYVLMSPPQIASYLHEQGNSWLSTPGEREVPSFLCCGEISAASRLALFAQMQGQGQFVSNVQAVRHASVLAMLALQRIQDGTEDDPLLLEPLYLRRPSITTSTRKQPLLGGTSHRPADQSPTGLNTTEREEGALRH